MMHFEKSRSAELAHFGIKGMRWGVRKEQPAMSTERRVIKKGTEFQNVSVTDKVQIGDRRIFTAHTHKDKLAYRSTYARTLKFMTDDADTFTNTLTSTRDLKLASEKDAFDAFKKLYDADPPGMTKAVAESHEALTRVLFGLTDKRDDKVVDIHLKKYTKKGEAYMLKQGYEMFLTGAGTDKVDRNLAEKYYTSLAKAGFDAMVDKTDKDAKLGDDPIVILKPKGNVKLKKSVPLTETDIDLAAKLYKEKKKSDKLAAKEKARAEREAAKAA